MQCAMQWHDAYARQQDYSGPPPAGGAWGHDKPGMMPGGQPSGKPDSTTEPHRSRDLQSSGSGSGTYGLFQPAVAVPHGGIPMPHMSHSENIMVGRHHPSQYAAGGMPSQPPHHMGGEAEGEIIVPECAHPSGMVDGARMDGMRRQQAPVGMYKGVGGVSNQNTPMTPDQMKAIADLSSENAMLKARIQVAVKEVSRLQEEVRQQQGSCKSPMGAGGDMAGQSRYWTAEEHQRFVDAIGLYGPKDVRQIANFVGTRNATQVRTHAQKYFLKMTREMKAKHGDKNHFGGRGDPSHMAAANAAMGLVNAVHYQGGRGPAAGHHQGWGAGANAWQNQSEEVWRAQCHMARPHPDWGWGQDGRAMPAFTNLWRGGHGQFESGGEDEDADCSSVDDRMVQDRSTHRKRAFDQVSQVSDSSTSVSSSYSMSPSGRRPVRPNRSRQGEGG
mmetsp:Transcript_25105/g.48889  ORF Transcript_25105/g.48889 Transcript_25105/m.48889 type:complete len:443 (+) Transcript_25105:221-1549(+)